MSGYWTGVLSILAINLVFAYGVFLPMAGGQLNLGGGGFQAVGAYGAAYLSNRYGPPVAVTLLAAMLLTGFVGFALAFPLSRMRGVYLILATFAFAEVVSGLIINSSTFGGALGLSVADYVDAWVPMTAAVVVALLVFLLMSTRFGLAMRAVHDDEVVADLMGVDVRGLRVASFAMGSALIGLSGGLYAHTFNFVDVHAFGSSVSIYVLLYVLIGGTQTAWGPLVGATFFTLLPELLKPVLPDVMAFFATLFGSSHTARAPDDSWRFVILGVVTIAVMALRPGGFVTRATLGHLRPRRLSKLVVARQG